MICDVNTSLENKMGDHLLLTEALLNTSHFISLRTTGDYALM